MKPKIRACKLVIRQFGHQSGVTEQTHSFDSLEELFALCVATSDPTLMNHIIIEGEDENGVPRTLSFVFQSLTATPDETA